VHSSSVLIPTVDASGCSTVLRVLQPLHNRRTVCARVYVCVRERERECVLYKNIIWMHTYMGIGFIFTIDYRFHKTN
jgi:hypothetical protein